MHVGEWEETRPQYLFTLSPLGPGSPGSPICTKVRTEWTAMCLLSSDIYSFNGRGRAGHTPSLFEPVRKSPFQIRKSKFKLNESKFVNIDGGGLFYFLP